MNQLKNYLKIGVLSAMIFTVGCNDNFEKPPEVTKSDDYVDLRPQQSALKSQGGRTTCIVFAAVAALEASYIRIGYGELDLSEEFANFTRKAFYLHPKWEDYAENGEYKRETQLGAHGGGGGTAVLAKLNKGFRIPPEKVMPYHTDANYYKNNFESLRLAEEKAREGTATQRDYSDFNLDPAILGDPVLRADTFYSVAIYRDIPNARNTDQIEGALKRGFEVVWDFDGADPAATGGRNDAGVWQKCDDCNKIAHSMLIVGYDKRDDNPDNHYFIVKNSWGLSFTAADENAAGYTYISYDYVRSYGTAANYIVLPNAPGPWPELAFIGRWKLNYDGFKGDLDIYHLPGMNDVTFAYNFEQGEIPELYDDYRIGAFYDSDMKPYRVNGFVSGNRIEFYLDTSTPSLRWDEIRGRRFIYYLDNTNFMAGHHTDVDGRSYGGYARKAGYLPGGLETGRPFSEQSYLMTTWDFYTQDYQGVLEFTKNATPPQSDHFLLEGQFTPDGGSSYRAQLKVNHHEANKTYIQIANMGDGTVGSFIGRHLNWEKGLITGNTPEIGETLPFYMVKVE